MEKWKSQLFIINQVKQKYAATGHADPNIKGSQRDNPERNTALGQLPSHVFAEQAPLRTSPTWLRPFAARSIKLYRDASAAKQERVIKSLRRVTQSKTAGVGHKAKLGPAH